MDIHDQYVETQKQKIIAEISWLAENTENFQVLIPYFIKFCHPEWVLDLSDEELQELAQVHGNSLYAQLQDLDQRKTHNLPLKAIVQELKH